MKISKRQLRYLIIEAMEDPRARLDLSRLSPDQLETLEMFKDPDDMSTYYMLLDSMLDPEGSADTYLDAYDNALKIFQKTPVNLNKDKVADVLSENGHNEALENVIDQDIFITVGRSDGLQIATPRYGKNWRGEDAVMAGNSIAGLDEKSISEIVKDLDTLMQEVHGKKNQYYLIERALLHAIIYLSKSATVFYTEALENGIIHLPNKTAAVAAYFKDLGARSPEGAEDPIKKIIVIGLERNGYTLDSDMVV
tara:strand:+ start:943 stop:1698 length:756 start_codon:yes stop_codon:yes gene_type:complete